MVGAATVDCFAAETSVGCAIGVDRFLPSGEAAVAREWLFPSAEKVSAPMDKRFTDRSRKVMLLANQEAQRYRHEYIGTEHILLGLAKEGSGVAAHVLRNLDIELGKIQREVDKLILRGPEGKVVIGKLPQTPRAKKVIEYAMDEARALNHNYVGTEHILLGLLRETEGVAAQILMNLGGKLEDMRTATLALLGHSVSKVRITAEEMEEPLFACPKCGGGVVRVVWNVARLTREEAEELAAGRALPMRFRPESGKDFPLWVCLACEPRWSEVRRLALQDYEWQGAKERAVASEDYETAIRLRESQRELRARLAALVQALLERS